MKSPFIRRVREAPGRQCVANASALSAIALGVVGVLLGTGVATTAIGVSDGMTWLADSRSGEVLQYNPSTKRVERSYQVGRPGDDISVSQDSGMVALRNERTNEVITVDLSRLRAAGARAAGGPAKVLVARGMMVLVDRDRGVLRRIDPVKATDLGETWHSAAPVADAVADQQGTVWVMVADGHLRALAWNDKRQRFDQTFETRVQRVADDGLLAAHPAGVSVFGPRAGVIAQVGTSNDSYRQSNQLVGIAPQATEGPSDLVVGALANSSSVVIIDRGEVRQVSTAELGCIRPINPAAFNGRVYVVCQGGNKVIQLRRDGRVAGPEIITPGSGDAQPVTDEGRLVLNVSGAREGIEIDRAGADQRFDRTSEVVTPTMRVESKPTNEGIEIGREQARADLAVEPLPDQPDSGSGTVNTSPEEFEDRTEVIDGDSSPSVTPGAEVPLPEAVVETPEPPAPEPAPQSSVPDSREVDRVRTPRPQRTPPSNDPEPTRPTPDTAGSATTPGSDGSGVAPDTDAAAVPDPIESGVGRGNDEAATTPGSEVAEVTPEATAESSEAASAAPAQEEVPAPTISSDSESNSESEAPASSGPALAHPTESGPTLTGSLGGPTAGTPGVTPSPAPSGPVPTPATDRATTTAAAIPDASLTSASTPTASAAVSSTTPASSTGTRAATPTPPTAVATTAHRPPTATTTATPVPGTPTGATTQVGAPTTLSSTPAPLAAPARLGATANGSSVTVTWAYSGNADHFEVAVGGRNVRVVQSARTATVTGNEPGTRKVTVTAVRGGTSRSSETTVTVGSPVTTPASGTPAPTGTGNTSLAPTSTSTAVTPPPTRSADPPVAPTQVRGTHNGSLATVQFDRVAGATSYTILCDDYGATTTTGTSGTVACGPDSADRAVKLGVRANNAAGSSAVAEVWVDPR